MGVKNDQNKDANQDIETKQESAAEQQQATGSASGQQQTAERATGHGFKFPKKYMLLGLIALIASFAIGMHWGSKNALTLQLGVPIVTGPEGPQLAQERSTTLAKRVMELTNLLDQESLSQSDEEKLTQGALQGILSALDDKYAEYFKPDEYARFQESNQGSFGGIGVVLAQTDKGARIVRVYAGGPAAALGMKPGDKIVAVGDKRKDSWSVEELASAIRLPLGTELTLSWMSLDEQSGKEVEKTATATIQSIRYPSLSYESLGDIGLIALSRFNDESEAQMKEAIEALEQQGAKALILDLRSNPGGPLMQALAVASQFLGKQDIVQVETNGSIEVEKGTKDAITDLPLVVLIDENSASSAEILCSALQDYKRAVVVGQLSYGKGTVQIVRDLSFGGGVKYTIAHYLSAAGHTVDAQGVLPDKIVAMGSDDGVLELKHQNTMPFGEEGKESFEEASPERINQLKATDPQLAAALVLAQQLINKPSTTDLEGLDNPVGPQDELTQAARQERDTQQEIKDQ